MLKKLSFFLIFSLLIFLLAGCESPTSLNNGTGELALFIADKPVNNVKNVYVTLEKVQVKRDNAEWETIKEFDSANGEGKFDLLTLRFDDKLLGQKPLPAGHYTQIRLIVAADKQGQTGKYSGSSKIVYTDGSEEDIFIPSGTQTGLKINHEFNVEGGVITQLVLDTDVSKIMHKAGNGEIILRPTAVNVIDRVISGDITGTVAAGDTNQALSSVDVVVEAVDSGGQVVESTVAAAEETTTEDGTVKPAGSYLLRGLPEGVYTVRAYVALLNDDGTVSEDTSNYTPAEESDVQVRTGETINLDLVLQPVQ